MRSVLVLWHPEAAGPCMLVGPWVSRVSGGVRALGECGVWVEELGAELLVLEGVGTTWAAKNSRGLGPS